MLITMILLKKVIIIALRFADILLKNGKMKNNANDRLEIQILKKISFSTKI